jgi:uncharacterized protein YbjT (DUF2867 family)
MSLNKKTALIIGASGLIGQELLSELLDSEMYQEVIILVRKSLGIKHPKLSEVIDDLKQIDLKGIKANHIYCTIGSTIKKAGSKAEFKRIDKEIPLEVAKQCHQNGADLFAIVTSMGADKNSMIFYSKVKGEVENELQSIGYRYLGLFRPSMLVGNRTENRLGENLGQIFMKSIDFITPKAYKAIDVSKVAKAMLQYAEIPEPGLSIILSDKMYD